MEKIFISYRRSDSADIVGRIYDYLTKPLGPFQKSAVFRDVDTIKPGTNFKTVLESAVSQCAVQLVVIGPHWLNITDEAGQRRLDNREDWVRIEIETALQRGIMVIPLLVNGASMPGIDDLPESLRDLCFQNYTKVRNDPDFKHDMGRVRAAIQAGLKKKPKLSMEMSVPSNDPTLEWCSISGGPVKLIEKNFDDSYIKRRAPQTFQVSSFDIAKYPVTNAQFAAFIKAGGYDNPAWWTEEGWQFREEEDWTRPRYWHDPTWIGLDCPVVGVSWFEAVAFCLWLSDVTHWEVLLPTEQQWQRAARGDEDLEYPWGKEFVKDCCNSRRSGLKRTTHVRQYETTYDGVFGAVDMSGNVWEWCATDYETGMQDINQTVKLRCARGGSWKSPKEHLRINYRAVEKPSTAANTLGFRCVRTQV